MNKIILLLLVIFTASSLKGQGQWIQQNSGTNNELNCVFFPTPETGYVGDAAGQVHKTIDGGTNWTVASTVLYKIFSMDFISIDTGLVTSNKIFKTTDGGQTWLPVLADTATLYSYIKYISKDTVAALCLDSINFDGKVFMSYDGGNNWNNIGIFPSIWVTSCCFVDSKLGFVSDINGNLYKTSNGGLSWSIADSGLTYSFNTINFLNKDTGFAGIGLAGKMMYTNNSGLNWSIINTGFSGYICSICFPSHSLGYAVGGNGYNSGLLLKTNNSGQTWTQATSSNQNMSCVQFPDTTTGYAVGYNGIILKYASIVGFGQTGSNSIISFYPNPVNDNNIDIKITQRSMIEILNIEGQIIKSINNVDKSINIDLRDLSSGVYIIKVKTDQAIPAEKQEIVTKKFIKI